MRYIWKVDINLWPAKSKYPFMARKEFHLCLAARKKNSVLHNYNLHVDQL
jgi:hypothetical protein